MCEPASVAVDPWPDEFGWLVLVFSVEIADGGRAATVYLRSVCSWSLFLLNQYATPFIISTITKLTANMPSKTTISVHLSSIAGPMRRELLDWLLCNNAAKLSAGGTCARQCRLALPIWQPIFCLRTRSCWFVRFVCFTDPKPI